MSEALKAYTYLCENVPKWLETIEDLRTKTSGKNDDVAKVAVPVTPAVRKSGSTETIRDQHMADGRPDRMAMEVTSAPQADQVNEATVARQQQALLAKRKRKTASVLSGHMSGPSKYRSRGLIIVYYDSEVQKSFEALVRNIGAGRNLLRKGKMAARIESLGNLDQESDDDDGDFDNPVLAKVGYRPKLGLSQYRTTRARVGFGHVPDASAAPDQFDASDKSLEKAQTLCERGAHQFLRDGDCSAELDSCKEQFREVIKLAETEAAKYRARDEENRLRREAREKKLERQREQKQDAKPQRNPVSDGSGLLEVDDASEEEEEEITLASLGPIRMTSRMAARV